MKRISNFIIILAYIALSNPLYSNTTDPLDSLKANFDQLDTKGYVDHLLEISEYQKSLDSSAYYIEQAIEIASSKSYTEGLLNGYLALGKVYDDHSFLEKAMETFNALDSLAQTHRDTLMMVKALCSKANIQRDLGKSKTAHNFFVQALDIINLCRDQSYKAKIYFGLGELYRLQRDVKQAIEYYSQAELSINNDKDQLLFLCRIKYGQANTYKVSGDTSLIRKGVNLLDEIINSDCFQSDKYMRQLSLAHTSKGGMHTFLQEYDLALHHINISIKLKKILKNTNSLAYSYTEMATLYYYLEDYEKSSYYSELAYQNHNHQDIGVHTDILDNLSLSFKEAKNYQKAFYYLKKANEMKDSLINRTKTEALVEMELKYQTTKQKEQLAQQELVLLEQKNKMNTFFIIGLLLLSIISFFSIWYYYQIRNKNLEASKAKELEKLKTRFLANISHEFRTPISLITGPLQRWNTSPLIENTTTEIVQIQKKDIRLVLRNANRLQQLISQMLDLSKVEINQVQLNTQEINLSSFVRRIVQNFNSLSEDKAIEFIFEGPTENLTAKVDKEKINIILNNLLSNAFKFTPENGQIILSLESIDSGFSITVSDNGEGIPSAHLPYIFDRFYQVDDSTTKPYEGSGIGLALTKELVELHHGTIEVESQKQQGSKFTVTFPNTIQKISRSIKKVEVLNFKQTIPLEMANNLKANKKEETQKSTEDQPSVLLVEDNKDMRYFIKQCLEDQFRIIEAGDGIKGLQLAKKHLPDLIISDVMMPGKGKDGFTFCKEIKENSLTSHIPVILLTAKANEEDRITGFELKADAYISKPFSPTILTTRVKNLIEQRQYLKVRFAESLKINAEDIIVSSTDQSFLQQVSKEIEKQISNENFGVSDLSSLVNMDRTQLFRKLKALTGQSPSQMIKDIRMQRAKYLLESNVANVSQVAQMVGYRNPEYFSQTFKKEFGISPSEILKSRNFTNPGV